MRAATPETGVQIDYLSVLRGRREASRRWAEIVDGPWRWAGAVARYAMPTLAAKKAAKVGPPNLGPVSCRGRAWLLALPEVRGLRRGEGVWRPGRGGRRRSGRRRSRGGARLRTSRR